MIYLWYIFVYSYTAINMKMWLIIYLQHWLCISSNSNWFNFPWIILLSHQQAQCWPSSGLVYIYSTTNLALMKISLACAHGESKFFSETSLLNAPITQQPFWYFPLKFEHLHLCGMHNEYIWPLRMSNIFGDIGAINCSNACHRLVCGDVANINSQFTMLSQMCDGISLWWDHQRLAEAKYDAVMKSAYYLTEVLWGVFCEYLWENWLRYNSTTLYCGSLQGPDSI